MCAVLGMCCVMLCDLFAMCVRCCVVRVRVCFCYTHVCCVVCVIWCAMLCVCWYAYVVCVICVCCVACTQMCLCADCDVLCDGLCWLCRFDDCVCVVHLCLCDVLCDVTWLFCVCVLWCACV